MSYIIKEQRNHRQKEMNETSVVIKFRGHKRFDYAFFQLSDKEACGKT